MVNLNSFYSTCKSLRYPIHPHCTDIHISWESRILQSHRMWRGGSGAQKPLLSCSLTIMTLPATSVSESQQGTPRANIPPEIWLEIMRSATDVPDSLDEPQLRHISEGTCLSGLAIERYRNSMVSHIQLRSYLI